MNLELRSIRSYVRRQGRITSAQQQALHQFSEHFVLSTADGILDCERVFNRQAPTVVEIGFGNGHTLLQMAINQPDINFIGIEVHQPGVGALLKSMVELQLNNIRIYQEDAVQVLNLCIKENTLHKVQIFFPDPWPKKKHHKRRLIQPQFINILHERLIKQGLLHLATDWQHYAEHMQQVIAMQSTRWQPLAFCEEGMENNLLRPVTKFEQRGLRLGHNIYDLLFKAT